MKETQLTVLLSQDKEESVTELEKLAKVIPPNCIGDLPIKKNK